MTNHDDFLDEYIEYRIFEESMKKTGNGKSPKKNSGCGCLTIAIIVCITPSLRLESTSFRCYVIFVGKDL